FSYCRQLCCLKVGKTKCGKIFIFQGKVRQLVDAVDQLFSNQTQTLGIDDDVRIVADKSAGGAQMNDSFCFWTLVSICVHMSHNVVSKFFFIGVCLLKVNV